MRNVYLKKISALATFIFGVSSLFAQTTLISPTGDGGFETGTTFALNNWTVVNAATNTWQVGAAATTYAGSRGVYVSNNSGTTWAYTLTSSQTSHFYKDVTVPAGQSVINLSFYWKGNGESGYDRLLVYTAPTSVTPVAGTPASSSTTLTGATLVYTQANNTQANYTQANFNLPTALAGTTFRLIFTWQNDGGGGTSPGAAIDNISLTSAVPTPICGTSYTIDNTLANTVPSGGTNFSSFTNAVNYLNANGICGALTINVAAGQTFAEDVPVLTATGTATNTITFQKSGSGANPKITPTGTSSSSDAGFVIAGGDYITLDGIDINAAAAVEHGLYVRNASATDGAMNNTFKNMVITLNSRAGSNTSYGVYCYSNFFTPSAATGANSNNKFYNMTVSGALSAGFYVYGGSSTYPDLNNEIGITACATRNSISNIGATSSTFWTAHGVYATNQSGIKIFNTDISAIASDQSTASGIYFLTCYGNSELYKNKITDISVKGSTTTTSIAYGMYLNPGSGTVSVKVYNNTISKIFSSRTTASSITRYAFGLYVSPTSATNTLEIDNNTVSMGQGINTGLSNACIEFVSGTGIYKVRNNIFANHTAAQGATSKHFCLVATTATLGATGSVLNYNDYYITTDQGTSGHVARNNSTSTNYNTLALWKAFATTLDANSLEINPSFPDNNTNLFSTVSSLNNVGTNLAWVTDDIACATRPLGGSNNDMGAYEINVCSGTPTAGAINAASSPICSGTGTTLSLTGATSGAGISYQWKYATVSGGPYTNLGTSATQATGNLSASTYYVCDVTCSAGPSTSSTAEYTLTVNTTPTVTASASASQYCGYGSIALTGSGATTYKWSPVTDLYTDSACTVAYTLATVATKVFTKPTANRTYVDTGYSSGCQSIGSVSVTLGKKVTISSVTAKAPSACSGGTDTITVVSSLPSTAKDYVFATSTGAALDPMTGATTIVASGSDDVESSVQNIGFTFNFAGTNFTQFFANSNGAMVLGSTSPITAAVASRSNNSTTSNTILPMWDDMHTGTNGGVSSVLTGTAPNRILKVQWNIENYVSTATAYDKTVQVWLYETTNVIEMRYGACTGTNFSSATVGIVSSSTSFNDVNTSTNANNTATAQDANTALPATGRMYSFTPTTLTYSWTSLNPSNTLINNTLSTAVATVNATGKYQIVVSETGGCSALDSSLSIALGGGTPAIAITPSNAATVCPATSVTLTSGLTGGCSPFTYSWSTGATSANITVSPTTTTIYNVTVTDNASATASATYTVNVFGSPVPTISPATAAACGSTPATLTATGGTTYKWSVTGSSAVTGLYTTIAAATAYTAGANQNPMYAKPTGVTSYTVTVTDGNSCTASASRSVNVYNALTATATTDPTTVCSGDTSRLNVTAAMNLGYGVSSTTYNNISGPFTAVSLTGDESNASVTIPFSFNFYGTGYTTVSLSTNGWLAFGGTATTYSYAQTVPNTTTPNNLIGLVWSDLNVTGTDAKIRTLTSGSAPNRIFVIDYDSVKFYNTGSNNGLVSGQIQLFETDNHIETHLRNVQVPTTGINATVGIEDATGSNGVAPAGRNGVNWGTTAIANEAWSFSLLPSTFTYNWSSPTAPTTISSTIVANPKLSNFGGTETYTVTVTEANSGCSVTANTTVTLSSTPLTLTSLTNSKPTYCLGDSSTLNVVVTGGCLPYTYAWSGGIATTASVKVKPTATTPYTVTVTDKGGATVTATSTVTVNPLPTPTITPTTAVVCGSIPATLTATGGHLISGV